MALTIPLHPGVPICLCIAVFASLPVSQQSLLNPLSHRHLLTTRFSILPITSKQSFLKLLFILSLLSLCTHPFFLTLYSLKPFHTTMPSSLSLSLSVIFFSQHLAMTHRCAFPFSPL